MKFDTKTIKEMPLADLHYYAGRAIFAQGNGPAYSQMLENRINRIEQEIKRRSNEKTK